MARTTLGRDAIKKGAEWLMWIDDDMVIPKGAVAKLLESGKKCITGHYYSRSHSDIYGDGTYPTNVFHINEKGDGHERFDPAITDGIHLASAAGFGCLLMHKDVFEAVDKAAAARGCPPFVSYPGCTEDVYWCNWAREAKQEIWYDASVRCGHLKMISVCDQTVPKPAEEAALS